MEPLILDSKILMVRVDYRIPGWIYFWILKGVSWRQTYTDKTIGRHTLCHIRRDTEQDDFKLNFMYTNEYW